MGLQSDGWDNYNAPVRTEGDGKMTCKVQLWVFGYNPSGSETSVGTIFPGDNTKGKGHAEMHALWQFLSGIGWDVDTFNSYKGKMFLDCPAKPCCKMCASVLGLLDIQPAPNGTKSTKTMGISYALNVDIRKFLMKRHRVSEQTIFDEFHT